MTSSSGGYSISSRLGFNQRHPRGHCHLLVLVWYNPVVVNQFFQALASLQNQSYQWSQISSQSDLRFWVAPLPKVYLVLWCLARTPSSRLDCRSVRCLPSLEHLGPPLSPLPHQSWYWQPPKIHRYSYRSPLMPPRGYATPSRTISAHPCIPTIKWVLRHSPTGERVSA